MVSRWNERRRGVVGVIGPGRGWRGGRGKKMKCINQIEKKNFHGTCGGEEASSLVLEELSYAEE